MIRFVCSVVDQKIETFGLPIFVPHTGAAVRSFTDEVRRQGDDNQLNKHPEDFDLFLLGEFDDQTGELRSLPDPQRLVRGVDCSLKDS